ncbi:hypothetical protein Sru01_38880 [Sphaerisporangium rufum]|uniref:OmpR/PhoB-type domain-containing protein n=1 Tax=Sphaerisporangium rufum TaxID=1381558 RepID=A0A919R392_9ACTN|nr:hypothetical protein Sru01_38880 [Sphaerisporangium rufum]
MLGSLHVRSGTRDLTPGAAKIRALLAMLVLRHNQIVPTRDLTDELWGDRPPATALPTLHTYVYKLRKLLGDGPATIITKPYGYLLVTAPDTIDAHRFDRLVADGWRSLERDDPRHATDALTKALALWRGPALTDITAGELLSAHITRLEEGRLRALELRLAADLRLGRHRQIISELKELIATHPLHEDFHAKLMTALYQVGRRGEALQVYQNLRRILVGRLGLEPSPALSRLQRQLLTADPRLDPPTTTTTPTTTGTTTGTTTATDPSPPPVPAQLPADTPDLTGRHQHITRLHDLLTNPAPTTPTITCLTGMPGAGTTTLAVHAAHRARTAYPDGQLYADLGAATTPADPADVLTGFLRATGTPAADIPTGRDERAKLFRTWCSGRRVLILLDDATGAAQITPLLPGTPGCAVIITAATTPNGPPGTHHLHLGPLTPDESLHLLAAIIGPHRLAAERPAAHRLAALCGHLPLALRAAAARLTTGPGLTLTALADRLTDPATRLTELAVPDLDPRTAFHTAYQRLTHPERGLFRLLGLLPTPDITTGQAAALLGCDPAHADHLLARLAAHSLLLTHPAPTGPPRHTIHDLLRLYARERLQAELHTPALTTTGPH